MSPLKMVLHAEKSLKPTIEKTYQNLRNLQQLCYSQTIFLRNFTYDSEASDLTKFHFETLSEILISSQLKLYTLYSN